MTNETTLHRAIFGNGVKGFKSVTKIKTTHIIGFAIVFVSLHFFALYYHWYFMWRPLDRPMHAAGGILLTLIFFWILESLGKTEHRSKKKENLIKTVKWCFIWIFFWSSLWEGREFFIHSVFQFSLLDTVGDYGSAFFGGGLTIAGIQLRAILL